MTLRESGFVAIIEWTLVAWALGFAINTVLAADYLTSPQWRSLMTVPGGKWFWTILFGGAALTLAAGMLRPGYILRGIGCALGGIGCAGIAVFYIIAPLFHLGPITLGYWPWFLGIGLGILGAVVNWWPIQWF